MIFYLPTMTPGQITGNKLNDKSSKNNKQTIKNIIQQNFIFSLKLRWLYIDV